MHRTTYRFGDFELDPASRELRQRGEPVSLPPKSFECLVYLLKNRERAVGRDELISAVWGRVDASDAVVAQTLLRARRAIGDTGSEQATVRTVPRFGYRWAARVEVLDGPAGDATAIVQSPAAAVDTPAPSASASPAEAPATPAVAVQPRRATPKARQWWALGAVLLVAAASFWQLRRHPTDVPASDLTIVLPVEIAPGVAEHAWIRLGTMDYIASRLRRNGGLTVLPSEQVLRLADKEAGERDAVDFIERLRATTGAHRVIAPEAAHGARGWRMRLQVHDTSGQSTLEMHGDSPLAAAASVSDALVRRLGRASADAGTLPAPTALAERLQQVDAELLAGQLASARGLIHSAPEAQRNEPQMRVREGQVEFRAGGIDAAAALYQSLLKQAGSLPTDVHAKALMGLGAVAIRRGDFAEVERRYTDALQVLDADTLRDMEPTLPGNAYNGRGVARVELGRMDEAIADFGRARIAMQRAGDEVEAASVGTNIGMLEARRGQGARALQEFERAIATFERFGVNDNLAAALQAKARSELRLLQPHAAWADSMRAVKLGAEIENPRLQDSIDLTHAEVLLAHGRLREADTLLQRLQQRGHPRPPASLAPLQLRAQLERGRGAEAQRLAQNLIAASAHPPDDLLLLAVQAALGNADLAQARAWLQRFPQDTRDASLDQRLAQALVATAAADHIAAERAFVAARAAVANSGVPEAELRAGCAHVAYLIARSDFDRASSIMGELSSFVDRDYRAAHTAAALYRALNDPAMQAKATAQVRALAGERDPSLSLVY